MSVAIHYIVSNEEGTCTCINIALTVYSISQLLYTCLKRYRTKVRNDPNLLHMRYQSQNHAVPSCHHHCIHLISTHRSQHLPALHVSQMPHPSLVYDIATYSDSRISYQRILGCNCHCNVMKTIYYPLHYNPYTPYVYDDFRILANKFVNPLYMY